MTGAAKVSVLLTCFNRRDQTLSSLNALFRQKAVGDVFEITVYLVDDGSSDGTGDAVRSAFPMVNVIDGDGSLYWNGGMRLAFSKAIANAFDFILWLNDDTNLDCDAILNLLKVEATLRAREHKLTAISGSTCDPQTGELTYGGFVRRKGPVLRLKQVGPDVKTPREVTTTAGNCLLLTSETVEAVGNIESNFLHAWGDVDYGLRLREKGGTVWLAPGFIARCESNLSAHSWRDDPDLSLRARFLHLNSFRGLYPADWHLFMRRHGGITWRISWAIPYIQLVLNHVKYRLKWLAKY